MLPKVIDLFSGCGGLALGFDKAGFEIVGGLEIDSKAAETIYINIDKRRNKDDRVHICGDITEIDPHIFDSYIENDNIMVIGGPPCQAYSMAGRGKLKSLGEERTNIRDDRGYLYQDFLRFVFELDADYVVMENVPESIKFGSMNIPEVVSRELESKGYNVKWSILNSADYGVPQCRERMILLAAKYGKNIEFPFKTHKSYFGDKSRYDKQIKRLREYEHFVEVGNNENLLPWVSVGEAISDLPELFKSSKEEYKRNNMCLRKKYRNKPVNEFQHIMRSWFGTEENDVSANVFRNNKRDFPIFELMKQGDNYIDAHRYAEEIFDKRVKEMFLKEKSKEYEDLKRKIIPPYAKEKFHSKWKKLTDFKPSHTVVAHLSKDTYSHIHPWEPRGISVREAARLQSFPDGFTFDNCSMGDAYKQIGNAVPPLFSYSIAMSIRNSIERE